MRPSGGRVISVVALLYAVCGDAGLAQPQGAPSSEAALECFLRVESLRERDCPGVQVSAKGIMLESHKYAPALVDSIMDGLEEIALTADSLRARIAAAAWLRLPGANSSQRPRAGVLARLWRLYKRSEDYPVHSTIIGWMPDQAERDYAMRFLQAVGAEDLPGDWGHSFSRPRLALMAILRFGEEGRDTLRAMFEREALTNREGRMVLEWLATRDFLVP